MSHHNFLSSRHASQHQTLVSPAWAALCGVQEESFARGSRKPRTADREGKWTPLGLDVENEVGRIAKPTHDAGIDLQASDQENVFSERPPESESSRPDETSSDEDVGPKMRRKRKKPPEEEPCGGGVDLPPASQASEISHLNDLLSKDLLSNLNDLLSNLHDLLSNLLSVFPCTPP